MKPTLLIVNKDQFGYHMDTFKYCQNLKNVFKITYLCFNSGKPFIEEEGIEVIYIPWRGSFASKGITFIKSSLRISNDRKFDHIFLVYFQFVFLFKLFYSTNNVILDIRTGSVEPNKIKRLIENSLIRFDVLFFKKITIISESLAHHLKIKSKKFHVIPLGSDILSYKNKTFKRLNLLYVGTLNYRNIHHTILGLEKFLKSDNFPGIQVKYDIVGFGQKEEENLVINTIQDSGLTKKIVFHGRKEHTQLGYFFDNCNVGVSYVPITEYYNCQPPTKTYEYISAGMVCIATNTDENKKLIIQNNGILCRDNPDDFCRALNGVVINKKNWDSKIIRSSLTNYEWSTISDNLKHYLLNSIN